MKKQLDESSYVRVTTVLSPYTDFSKVPPETLEKKKIIGTLTHDLAELYALDSLIEPIPDFCKGYFQSFKDWFDTYVDEVISTEERIYHPKYFFTGKYDLLCRLKGDSRVVLVDYKTCVLHYKTWRLQSGAYLILLQEVKDTKVDRRITLKLDKEGGAAKATEYTNHDEDRQLFMYALQIYRFLNP